MKQGVKSITSDVMARAGQARYRREMTATLQPVGSLLREWRQRRRLSQLELACEAEISTRHLSFLETGRSQPSREMIINLAETLDIPLRERNALLLAAGYAPTYGERSLADPALRIARKAVELVLAGHEPYPALAIDRHWTMVSSNKAVPSLLKGVDPELLRPPVNVLRLALHPRGVAPRVANYEEWRAHLLARLRRQIQTTADKPLADLMQEIAAYPVPSEAVAQVPAETSAFEEYAGVILPLLFVTGEGRLNLFSTTTMFGTPVDITLSELAIESFFPADDATAAVFHAGSAWR
jgi:transcriptional regulator with XRE-family HTH domain